MIAFDIKPSRYYQCCLALVVLGAQVSIGLCRCPIEIKVPLSVACLIYYGFIVHRYVALMSVRSIVQMIYRENKFGDVEWILKLVDGSAKEAALLPDRLVVYSLVILNFKIKGKRWAQSVVLFHDSMGVDAHRRLRVLLRFI